MSNSRIITVLTVSIFSIFINPLFGQVPAVVPVTAHIEGIPWIAQTWNNCGPANLAMVMQFSGIPASQQNIAGAIRPNFKDPHADINDMAVYARQAGLEAEIFKNAELADIKVLVAAGFPVIVPTWHIDEDGQEMGHYRTVYGYDDELSVLYLQDSLDGPEVTMDYPTFDFLWSIYQRPMLLISRDTLPEGPELSASGALVLPDIPTGLSTVRAKALLDFSQAVAASEAGQYEEAVTLLEEARPNLPWRIWWYQPRVLEAYRKTGRQNTEIDIILACLNPYPYSEELFYLLALAYDGLGETDAALAALKASLELRPGWLDSADLAEFSADVLKGL